MTHGTNSGYAHGCRCTACTKPAVTTTGARYQRRKPLQVDRKLLSDLLQDMFPLGLTDDCPARRGQR
jgi:hypothetical protein